MQHASCRNINLRSINPRGKPLNWTALHARLHQTLRSRSLLPSQQSLLIAVSGGQDSLCLAQLLLDLQPKWGWSIAIAHCNHRWRSDSAANAAYVEHLAQDWQLPYYSAIAPSPPQGEAAARQWRYQALAELAIAHHATIIVTGHTASDRAETLLYNLMRGSGADGLQALTWQRELVPGIGLVRPLLEMRRSETAQFCQQRQIQIWEDSTNQNWHYARNRIRQELLPYLQTHFNPQVETTIAQTAELLRAEVEYLEALTEEWWQQAIAPTDQILLASMTLSSIPPLNRLILRQAPLALQRRVLRRWLQLLSIAANFEQIEKLVALLNAPNRSQTDPFPGGAIAQVQSEWIMLKAALD